MKQMPASGFIERLDTCFRQVSNVRHMCRMVGIDADRMQLKQQDGEHQRKLDGESYRYQRNSSVYFHDLNC